MPDNADKETLDMGALAGAEASMNPYWFEDASTCPLPDLLESTNTPWEALGKLIASVEAVAGRDGALVHSTASVSSLASIEGNVIIGRNVEVGPGAVIEGPAFISDGTVIAPGAYVHTGSAIGAGCRVEHGSEVSHSLILDGTSIGSFALVADSVVGTGCAIGPGAVIANSRFDRREVEIAGPTGPDGSRMSLPSGQRSFGAVIGDKSNIGAGCVVQPGTLIGRESDVYPATAARGFVPDRRMLREAKPLMGLPKPETAS